MKFWWMFDHLQLFQFIKYKIMYFLKIQAINTNASKEVSFKRINTRFFLLEICRVKVVVDSL